MAPMTKIAKRALQTQQQYDTVSAFLMQTAFDKPTAGMKIAETDDFCQLLTALRWEFECTVTHDGDYITGVSRVFTFKLGATNTQEHIKGQLTISSSDDEHRLVWWHTSYLGRADIDGPVDLARTMVKFVVDGVQGDLQTLQGFVESFEVDDFKTDFGRYLSASLKEVLLKAISTIKENQ